MIWSMWAGVVVLVAVTYARIPPAELYHVSRSGLAGGLGRALVYLDFPMALVAALLLAVTYHSLTWRWKRPLAIISLILCVTVAIPGMVDEDNLDARLINVLPALGVGIALMLTWSSPWVGARVTRAGLALATCLAVVSLPWIAAETGFSLPRGLFMTSDLVHEPGEIGLVPAVHLGDHHGLGSALLILTALAVWATPRGLPRTVGRRVTQAFAALLLAYGVVNMVQDFWGEQIADRGWTDWSIPDASVPEATLIWGIILIAAAAVYWLPHGDSAGWGASGVSDQSSSSGISLTKSISRSTAPTSSGRSSA